MFKLPRITKHTSYKGDVYYNAEGGGYCVSIPGKLTEFLGTYKVIGNFVYVKNPIAIARVTPDWDLAKVYELMSKHGKKATLKQVVEKANVAPQWVKVTDSQQLAYKRARAALDKWLHDLAVTRYIEMRKNNVRRAKGYLTFLVKEKIICAETEALLSIDIQQYVK